MDAAPVIARGHNVAVFVPPVREAALPVLESARRPLLVLTPDAARAATLARGSDAFAVAGLERARRKLATTPPAFVFCGAADALTLLERSAMRPAQFAAVALAWPEQLDEEGAAALAAVLAECDKDAQRLILTARSGSSTDELIERYAFKAMTFGFPAADAAPATPLGPARYVIAPEDRQAQLAGRVLDAINPDDDSEVVVAACPASREAAQQLLAAAGATPPVILAAAHQVGWLRTLFSPLSSLHLPTAADAADQRAGKLRARLARLIDSDDLTAELLALGPLLEHFDPALVAAAAVRLIGGAERPGGAAPARAAAPQGPSTIVKVWVGVGRKDGAKPGDLVGVIVNEAKVAADAIGKIDVKDLFCLVEVRSELAEQVVKGLTGRTLRGRRLVARVDRGPGAGARPPRRI